MARSQRKDPSYMKYNYREKAKFQSIVKKIDVRPQGHQDQVVLGCWTPQYVEKSRVQLAQKD